MKQPPYLAYQILDQKHDPIKETLPNFRAMTDKELCKWYGENRLSLSYQALEKVIQVMRRRDLL